MFELFRALIAKKAVTLSPEAATIGETAIAFRALSPIVALNSQAHVSIDVTGVVPVTHPEETLRRTELAFPPGCIRAVGVRPDGSTADLIRQFAACSSTGAFVQLFQEDGADEVKFSEVNISACRPIPNASVTWFSYGK